jgi:hypothetical protein
MNRKNGAILHNCSLNYSLNDHSRKKVNDEKNCLLKMKLLQFTERTFNHILMVKITMRHANHASEQNLLIHLRSAEV